MAVVPVTLGKLPDILKHDGLRFINIYMKP